MPRDTIRPPAKHKHACHARCPAPVSVVLLSAPIQRAAGQHFVLEEALINDVPGASGAEEGGGEGSKSNEWMGGCRTKFVGFDGKALPPPAGGYDAPLS